MIERMFNNVYCPYSQLLAVMCAWQVRSPRDVIGVDSDDDEEDDEEEDESGNEMDMFEMVSGCNCLNHVMTR